MKTLDRRITIRIAECDIRWLKARLTNPSSTLSQVIRDLIRACRNSLI